MEIPPVERFGRGFSERNLVQMRLFYQAWPIDHISQTPSAKLPTAQTSSAIDEYSESDLEEALIQHLADFLLELGDDFAFVGRQRRLRIDDSWHMYLNYAREHWMKPGENPPVGLILCASKGSNEVHYALEGLSNKVLAAEYQTVLPNENLLAAELARTRRELEDALAG